jgi:hypothetical protein
MCLQSGIQYSTSQTFLTLNRPGSVFSTRAVRTLAAEAAGLNRPAWTGVHVNRHQE